MEHYNENNYKELCEQLKHNITSKDNLVVALSTFFMGGSWALLTTQKMSGLFLSTLFIISLFFMISFFSTLLGFEAACKSTKEQKKLFIKGYRDDSQKLEYDGYIIQIDAIRIKYYVQNLNNIGFFSCLLGSLFLFLWASIYFFTANFYL